jgi:gamma-glutamylcyclotransferase (GGCT)/AIG2-like uncharacterized protein YtfP
MTEHIQVFVYGTLKPGEVNYRICAPYVLKAQPAITIGQVYHLPFNYPAMTIATQGVVHGSLLSFADAEILSILDNFEQHDPATFRRIFPEYAVEAYQYSRKRIKTYTPRQTPLTDAWGYVMEFDQIHQLKGLLIPAGYWSQQGIG